MGRPRLTPEEREARRKARARFSFSDAAYKHYDPETEGFGGPDQWEEIAFLLGGGAKPQAKNDLLSVLGLVFPPSSLAELKTAFRAAMMKAHPDKGGSNEAARKVMEAFETLRRQFA